MSRLNVNSVNPHDGVKVSVTGSTNGGVVISGSGDNVGNPLLAVHGTVSASGNITASNAFFSGDIHGVGNIYVQGHATLSAYTAGGIQLGDTNTDNVTFGADVNSHVIPNINNTYDLGSDAQEWRNIYVEGTGYIDTIIQDDTSITNTFKGDSQFIDDAGSVSLQVHSADGNIGVKVADPNVDFEVAGNISSSGWLSLGGAGSANGTKGHLTASGNAVISGTLEVLGDTTLQDLSVANFTASGTTKLGDGTEDYIRFMGNVTASGNIRAGDWLYVLGNYTGSGTHQFGNNTADFITIAGNVTSSGNFSASSATATHSFDGLLQLGEAANPQGKLEVHNPNGQLLSGIKSTNLDISNWAFRGSGARLGMHVDVLRSNTSDYVFRAGDSALNGIFEVMGGGTGGKTIIGNNISGSHVTGDHILGGTLTVGTSTIVLSGNAGHITASGNISMSATSTLSMGGGMTISNVTASANISTSAGIIADTATISGLTTLNGRTVVGSNHADRIELNGHLTASVGTNISGSSTSRLTMNEAYFDRSIHVGSGGGLTAIISSSGMIVGQNITASNTLTVEGKATFNGTTVLGNNTADHVTIIGNITGSGGIAIEGNISTSADITANDMFVSGLFSRANDSNTGLQFGSDTVDIEANDVIIGKFTSAQIQLNRPVTASHTITASALDVAQASHLRGRTVVGSTIADRIELAGHTTMSAGAHFSMSATSDFTTANITASNATFNGGDGDLMVISPKVSASAELGALVLHGRNSGSIITNAGGAVNTSLTEANFPGKTVFGVNQSTAGNAIAVELPAATAGLEYTFIATVTSGNTTTTFSAPSAILNGIAICDDGTEDVVGTHFAFAATKFIKGTRVHCISDGTIWHISAFCLCDLADVSTS